ncbi:hypothetical protein NKR19_g3886 [Coniochaeta hoffmannii]|uniref:NADH dehydrogenase [ubiquinone] 1 beta subcomplex subunit 2 n=1 Tax=Coniochaeta hoffmannii TaxID=91930 RepID=A0AA38SCI8_9PEZI|nr:hypothetical protein NKR19_g3886 [Coniochaeta hoffmannii]
MEHRPNGKSIIQFNRDRKSLSHHTSTHRCANLNTGTMAGLKPHVPAIYRVAATGLGASMWFFLMYRAKKDGPVLMGWKHPWDH